MKNISGCTLLTFNVEDEVPGFLNSKHSNTEFDLSFFFFWFYNTANFLSLEKCGEGNW